MKVGFNNCGSARENHNKFMITHEGLFNTHRGTQELEFRGTLKQLNIKKTVWTSPTLNHNKKWRRYLQENFYAKNLNICQRSFNFLFNLLVQHSQACPFARKNMTLQNMAKEYSWSYLEKTKSYFHQRQKQVLLQEILGEQNFLESWRHRICADALAVCGCRRA